MSYSGVVLSDNPTGYWQFLAGHPLDATVGPALTFDNAYSTGASMVGEAAIVGEEIGGWLDNMGSGDAVYLPAFADSLGEAGNASSLAEFTIELWFKASDATPAAQRDMILGQLVSASRNWRIYLNTSGTIGFNVFNSTPSLHGVTSSAITADTWHHVVATIDDGSVRLYVNGTQAATPAPWTGTVNGPHDANERMSILGAAEQFFYDELAFYPFGLSAARIAAHFEAGAQRGFPAAQLTGARAGAILDSVDSHAPRRLDAGARQIVGRFMHGQSPLEELRDCAKAEAPDGVLFISRSGEIVLLDSDHRSSSPYDTVQATFDDDGSGLPYHDLDVDFSDAFLINDWNLIGVGDPNLGIGAGSLDSSEDATSIATYGKRSQSADFPIHNSSALSAIGDALLAKTKDPMTRVLSITFKTSDPDLTEAIFRRDIGDRIRLLRTPPGGGTRLDFTLFIQSIKVSGTSGSPLTVTWGVSPL